MCKCYEYEYDLFFVFIENKVTNIKINTIKMWLKHITYERIKFFQK